MVLVNAHLLGSIKVYLRPCTYGQTEPWYDLQTGRPNSRLMKADLVCVFFSHFGGTGTGVKKQIKEVKGCKVQCV